MTRALWTEAETDSLARLYVEGVSWEGIAAALNRPTKSCTVRMVEVRRERKIPVRPRSDKPDAERMADVREVLPVTLNDDAALVRLTLAEGGFPRAVITPHGTVWVGPDGKGWRHYTVQRRGSLRRAA